MVQFFMPHSVFFCWTDVSLIIKVQLIYIKQRSLAYDRVDILSVWWNHGAMAPAKDAPVLRHSYYCITMEPIASIQVGSIQYLYAKQYNNKEQ